MRSGRLQDRSQSAAIKAYACFGSIRAYLHGPPGRETKTGDEDGMKASRIFYKWLWQSKKEILVGYPVLIFTVSRLLLELDGRNGSVHKNYLLVARELQTQHKIS